ncbi:hypothetical protein BJ878DRAFT_225437 [Calycina marina]|uniref:Zn(2)-C6 fungal-type domain-containing protein n=1 Tax=Calycina marina TaxID=1763456 RepID=A0A9P8CDN7_9HELO|nr:hypothetical protein BJ878DRAFT_225437 [Calycina marina]
MVPNWAPEEPYMTNDSCWSQQTITQQQKQSAYSNDIPSHLSILSDSQSAHNSNVDSSTLTRDNAFKFGLGSPYGTYPPTQQYLDPNSQLVTGSLIHGPISPNQESDNEHDWDKVSATTSCANSPIRSHGSPRSDASWQIIDTPPESFDSPQSQTDHIHIFHSTLPGLFSPKLPKGRQRQLSSQEKKEALEVRKAGACWACHLSKIKCSPCSPGSPCQQCARLAGKRRFCWVPCFNDPLESLKPMFAPDYLNSGFTQPKVELFINQNVAHWGSQEIIVQMYWVLNDEWRPIQAGAVSLQLSDESELAFTYGTNKPTNQSFRRESVPLGIPLDSMCDMEKQCTTLVQETVMESPNHYVDIAYNTRDIDRLPERLLGIISNFYLAGLAAGDECETLRQALEVHVVETILGRTLSLDQHSLQQVERHSGRRYPPRSASRCLQRQVKLAFYKVQQDRILKVLENWGFMMWTGRKDTPLDKRWATSFTILLTLILVINKTLEAAYRFCESQINYHNANPIRERAKLHELVRLTEKELFERFKEIFHSSFKTTKGGKRSCNPIRDNTNAFRDKPVSDRVQRLVLELKNVMHDYGAKIREHKNGKGNATLHEQRYTNPGQLASIFLADFLDH